MSSPSYGLGLHLSVSLLLYGNTVQLLQILLLYSVSLHYWQYITRFSFQCFHIVNIGSARCMSVYCLRCSPVRKSCSIGYLFRLFLAALARSRVGLISVYQLYSKVICHYYHIKIGSDFPAVAPMFTWLWNTGESMVTLSNRIFLLYLNSTLIFLVCRLHIR